MLLLEIVCVEMACETLPLAINVLQTQSCCRIEGSYEQEPIPPFAKTDLKGNLPEWCTQPSAFYRLCAIGTNEVFDLGSTSFVTVGRNVAATVVLSSLSVSRMHAALMHDSLNQTFLVDLGSSHGTFIGSHRLTPYVPTLITKKSLIRFGTVETQYLLLSICSNEFIYQCASQLESNEDKQVFLNTQLNMVNTHPAVIGREDPNALFFGRFNTLNFVNTFHRPPELKRAQASCESVATCFEEPCQDLIAKNMACGDVNCGVREANIGLRLSSPIAGDDSNGSRDSPVRIQISNSDLPTGNFSMPISPFKIGLSSACFSECGNFIRSDSLSNEHSIKRCATVAGVDDEEEAVFASSCPTDVEFENMSGSRYRRRRMSEEVSDYTLDRGGIDNRAMSISLEGAECPSIGGSSNGFISSGSMSEVDDGDDEKKRKKVRFWDVPMEILSDHLPFDSF